MRTTQFAAFFLGIGLLLLPGCKKDGSAKPLDPGYEYFPINVGKWVEYQVDSLWRDDAFNVLDSVSYRVRERIEEQFTDPGGRIAQRIHRYVQDNSGAWLVRDVWMSTRSISAAERSEEDVRRLKLSFPIREGRLWDVNVYNSESELTVALRDVDKPWSHGGYQFDSTAIVRNTQEPNVVETRNYVERYAKQVGLVSRYWEEMRTNILFPPPTPTNPNPPPMFVTNGFRLNMVIVDHGQD